MLLLYVQRYLIVSSIDKRSSALIVILDVSAKLNEPVFESWESNRVPISCFNVAVKLSDTV